MKNLKTLEKTLGVKFKNKDLLAQALVHRSYLNENPNFKLGSNERLEFLGDAVLEFVSSLLLYKELPDHSEGNLTNIRSWLVRTSALAESAEELKLGAVLLLSKGEEDLGGKKNHSLLADLFEAVIGAIFLDRGITITEKFLLKILKPKLKKIIKNQSFKDPKSLFQELIQGREKITPQYTILEAEGPDHDKTFTVGLWVEKKLWAKGKGKNKLEAEQKAATKALKKAKKLD